MLELSSTLHNESPWSRSHFLNSRSFFSRPPLEIPHRHLTYRIHLDRYLMLLAMRNSFWGKWKKEVLHHMVQLNKWYFPQRNLQIGDLVLMTNESSPPTCWSLARVISIGSNRSGLVRSVTIKTAESVYERPVHKRVYLPFSEQHSKHTSPFTSVLRSGDFGLLVRA